MKYEEFTEIISILQESKPPHTYYANSDKYRYGWEDGTSYIKKQLIEFYKKNREGGN